jgi:hypothetical protein
MYLSPLDIACYVYCPVLQAKGATRIVAKPLTFTEQKIRAAIIEAERHACLKDSIVSPRKLRQAWDKIWWPAAEHLPATESTKISLAAAHKFTDYCKYDMSDWMMPTAGVEAESTIRIGTSVLKAQVDIVKVDLEKPQNTVLINLDRKGLSLRQAATDPAIKAIAYAFYSGRGETITYISIDVDESIDKISVTTSTFSPKAMEGIRKMLYHVECGIRSRTQHANPYACKECKVCQDFTL